MALSADEIEINTFDRELIASLCSKAFSRGRSALVLPGIDGLFFLNPLRSTITAGDNDVSHRAGDCNCQHQAAQLHSAVSMQQLICSE